MLHAIDLKKKIKIKENLIEVMNTLFNLLNNNVWLGVNLNDFHAKYDILNREQYNLNMKKFAMLQRLPATTTATATNTQLPIPRSDKPNCITNIDLNCFLPEDSMSTKHYQFHFCVFFCEGVVCLFFLCVFVFAFVP